MAGDSSRPTHRSLNWVWDVDTLTWVSEKQAVLNAGAVTVAGTGLSTETTLALVASYSKKYTYAFDYNGGTTVIYRGATSPGNATSAATWQITKMTYDGNSNVTSITFASGTDAFTRIWDNRAGYTYS